MANPRGRKGPAPKTPKGPTAPPPPKAPKGTVLNWSPKTGWWGQVPKAGTPAKMRGK